MSNHIPRDSNHFMKTDSIIYYSFVSPELIAILGDERGRNLGTNQRSPSPNRTFLAPLLNKRLSPTSPPPVFLTWTNM